MNRIKPVILTTALISLAACSSNKQEQPQLDYQSQTRKIVSLDVPPDLTNPDQGNMYNIPAGSGAVRASDLNRRNTAQQQAANQTVLQGVKGVHLERDGSQRWLVIDGKQPAEIWPLLKVFWQENGFNIQSEEPAIGQMETEWAENRAKIPQDGLRRLFERVGLGGIYSTGERDKFIVRVEQGRNNTTDVFFAHKGMIEVYTDKEEDTTMWQPRPNDPNLEAAFLARFMQYLGVDAAQAEQALGNSVAASRTASDLATIEGNTLLLQGNYDRNWRRTALALDRIGLTVIGQNAERHALLVQPAPQEGQAVTETKPGFFKRIFGRKKAAEPVQQERPELIVYVEPVANGTRLHLLNRDGTAYQGRDASTWLSRLHTELR
ncbi:outer membrane protein assembly factor BamC [Neisseria montereyensis]|uniref:Outer membrane protein assembly factor BamC n=1 Tax=Neisseria montereyensis TaxID=2973938 RepID=A0ABT2FFV5_9NEIS|nr:outer membrane protein assembly factor BamC [Neisseria montereyensis]MCS4534330.1 outer membrane protein assembly factor BamC [Neisseria montereyensis]